MSIRGPLLYVCFFLSGISALIYEIVWQRMLTLVFGLSTLAVAAVVAAFLAGLALGARCFGGWADRTGNVVRLYAGLELAIAGLGLASGFFIPPLLRLFELVYGATEPGWLLSNLIRFVLAFLTLSVPSILIGGTVPCMARIVSLRACSVATGFGRFYAINTLGSVAGAALAGFALIRTLGMAHTLHVAVLGNVTVAALAAWAGRGRSGGHVDRESTAGLSADVAAVSPRFVLAAAALTGAVALAFEVAWARLLAIFTFNSVYVFTMLITVYLAALAAGTGLATRLLRRPAHERLRLLAGAQALLALSVPVMLAAVPAAGRLRINDPATGDWSIFLMEYGLAAAVAFVPTVLMGMSLPLLVGLLPADVSRAGRLVGRVYAWNATGTIAGAALAGVVFIPLCGLRGTLLLLAAVSFAVAAAAAAWEAHPPRWWRNVVPGVAAVWVLGVALLPPAARFCRPADQPDATLIHYAEGPAATVHVAQFGSGERGYRTLYVDSKAVAGTHDEIVADQKMLAHLPLLLHPAPQRALTVGFGTGGTSYSMLQHGVHVDCAEIEPEVPRAFRFFASENQGIVGPDHERADFHLILDDVRAWLQVAPHPYDVIVTDVTAIQYRGNGNLYTTDYFRLMQARLTPGGLGCAWVPLAGVTPEQLRILVRSFADVYPHTSIWYIFNLPTDFVILVGTPEVLALDLANVAVRMARPLVRRDLARIGLDNVYQFAACLLLAEADVATYAGAGPLHTDDHPLLDYLTHASSYRKTIPDNLGAMLRCRSPVPRYVTAWPPDAESTQLWATWSEAAELLMRGHVALYSGTLDAPTRAGEQYLSAARLVPGDAMICSLAEEYAGTSE